MNTYEITLTVVTDTSRNGIEADARWLAGLMTSEGDFTQECWVENIERVATYDVRDPDAHWQDKMDDFEPQLTCHGGHENREGDPAFNGAFNKW